MRCFLIIFTLFLTDLPILQAEQDPIIDSLKSRLNKSIEDREFVGGTIGLAIKGKFFVTSAGFSDLKNRVPFTDSTLNRIASISKSMTAVATLQLYEQGKLNLDEPISTLLPKYPKKYADKITTRHLLQHSSGIAGYQSVREAQNKKHYSNLTEAAQVFQNRPLLDEPGKTEYYSTYNYVVLGMIIEAISGTEYEEYMKDEVWKNAKMSKTGVEQIDYQYPNKSKFYRKTKKGKLKSAKANNLSNRIPGGGIYSTAEDLLKFGQAVLDHKLISKSIFDLMMKEPGIAYEGNPYGMGWFLYGKHPELGQVYGHTGGQTGCSSVLLLFPEKDAIIVVMSNTSRTISSVFNLALSLYPVIENTTK